MLTRSSTWFLIFANLALKYPFVVGGGVAVVCIDRGAAVTGIEGDGTTGGLFTGDSTAKMQPSALREFETLYLSSGLGVVVGGAVRILFMFYVFKRRAL